MKHWTGTVSKTARAFVACALAFLASSAGAATVRDIGIKTHYPWNGLVDVTYAVGGIAPGSSYHVTAKLVAGGETWCTYATNVHANALYAFQWDVAASNFVGRAEDAQVVFTVAEPDYVAIDLSAGPTASAYPIAYINRESIDDAFIRTNVAFKTDQLLLKRVVSADRGITNYVGVFEVTQRQYERVMGTNPAYFSLYADDATVCPQRPVERVSYELLTKNGGFFDSLTNRTHLSLALPTSAEWAAAARGRMPADKQYNLKLWNGQTARWEDNYKVLASESVDTSWLPYLGRYVDLWANGVKTAYGNNTPNEYSDETKGTAIVGSYPANDNGLYDIHGNVAEWTGDSAVAGYHNLRGGAWQSLLRTKAGAEPLSADAVWSYKDGDESQLYCCGFRVFGAEPHASFEKETTVSSDAFAIDVDEDNVRQARVVDFQGNRANDCFYTPQGGSEIDWVAFDDPATADGVNWKPTHYGINVATNGADNTVTSLFNVATYIPMPSTPVSVTYDGESHTIEYDKAEIKAPSDHSVVYWSPDRPGQATEAEATADPIYFTAVKRGADNAVRSYEIWYKVIGPDSRYETRPACRRLTINPRSIRNVQVACRDTLTYNARLQTNDVTQVTLLLTSPAKTLFLTNEVDFALSGNIGTDAQKYATTLTGTGNYEGILTRAWEILPLDFGDIKPGEGGSGTQEKKAARVNCVSDYHRFVYNGRPQTNYVLSVSINGVEFDPSSGAFDAERVVDNVKTDVGTYRVVVTGTRNFKGNLTNEWTIAPLSITNATVSLDAEFDYNGDCQTRSVTNVTVATGGYEMPSNPPAIPATITIPSYAIDVPAAWYYVRGNTGTNASAKVGAYTLGVWAKSREGNNFCGHVYTNWFIGQRDLTNAVFTTDATYPYVYDGTAKTPGATAADRESETVPTITPTTNVVAGATNDWTIAGYLDNVSVGGDAKIVFAATENGNYRGVVTNGFQTGVQPAVIASVAIVNPASKSFDWDGTEKVISVADVTVRTANGLVLSTNDYAMAGTFRATASGAYALGVEPLSGNFTNAVPAASDAWSIVTSAPRLAWTTPTGATNVTGDAGTILFGTSDLTLAAVARADAISNVYAFVTADGSRPVVRDDKFHVTGRTRITVYSVFDAGSGTVLTGEVTTVELVPGRCADPKISIKPGTEGYVAADRFNRNDTSVTIEPTDTVNGVKVREYGNDPFWPAWESSTNGSRRLYYTLRGRDGSVITSAVDYAENGLRVSADTVTVEAWMHDASDQYLDSIHVTTNLVRVIDTELPAPVIGIVTNGIGSRTVTITDADPKAMIYFTTNCAVRAEAEAVRPAGPMEISRSKADRDATVAYDGPFDIWLDKDASVDIKAIAYTNLTADAGDFVARSEVADLKDVREWTIGDALKCPGQVFTNGWSSVPVPKVENPDPANPADWTSNDVPWYVCRDATAGDGECMRSGPLSNGNYRTSSLSTAVRGPGLVVFRWRANCEDDPNEDPTWDHGEFLVDGAVTNVWPGGEIVTNKIDGVTGWIVVTNWLDNSKDEHVLTWVYKKDFLKDGVHEGEAIVDDGLFLDDFKFYPAGVVGELRVTVSNLTFNTAGQTPCGTGRIHAFVGIPGTSEYELVEGVDYEAAIVGGDTCKTNADTYQVELKSKAGSYYAKGVTTNDWQILPLDITSATVGYTPNFTYTGIEQTNTLTSVKVQHPYSGELDVLNLTDDYDLSGDRGTNVGPYQLQITGKNNLTGGPVTREWTIGPKTFEGDITVTVTPEAITYLEATPSVTVRDTERDVILTNNVDYTLTWPADTVNVGEKTITVTGMGNYGGQTKTATYRITQRNISAGTITPDYTTVTYNGIGWRNNIKVKNDLGSNLVENVDYRYIGDSRTQTNAGTYTNKIEGIGNYWSTNQITWTIKPIDMSTATLTLDPSTYSFEYDGTAKAVKTNDVKSAKVGKLKIQGYTVACDEKTEKGDYTFTVTSTDPNFSGTSQPQAWSIGPRSLTNATITLTTNLVWNGVTVITNNGQKLVRTVLTNATEQTMTFTVTDRLNGTVTNLVLGTDYEIVPGTDKGTNACRYVLQITGLGNYAAATSNEWVIAPSLVTITPNVENPGTNEVIYAEKGVQRVQMERDDGDWTLWMRRTVFDAEGKPTATYVNPFRSFVIGQRTQVDGWAVTADGVTGSVRTVDFRIGHAAEPFAVLADADNIPYLYEDGTPWTNTVDGAVITNFCHNGQLVYLTRGNLAVSNDVAGARILFTNSTDQAYTNGVLRYTIDGTEPTAESPAWTAGSRLAITNTTTVLSKVFGGQFIDSPVATNVFVREFEGYAPPEVTYFNRDIEPQDWQLATNGETVAFNQIGQRVRIADTNLVGGTIYYSTNSLATTNAYAVGTELVFDHTTTLIAWIGDGFDVHNYSNSASVTVCFDRDQVLAQPNIAFADEAELAAFQYNDTYFSNAYQKVRIWRDNRVGTKYTDGKIVYTTNDWVTTQDYVAPFVIWGGTTVKAKATGGVYGYSDSDVTNVVFTQHMAALDDLVVTVTNAPTVKQAVVTITNNTGNIVYYTLDGSDPIGVNETGVKNGETFAGTFKTFARDLAIGETLVVKAVAYTEVTGGRDYVAISKVAEDSVTRNWSIGDSIKPDDPAKQAKADQPDASDRAFDNTDNAEYGNTNTAWVVDETYFVATNAQGKGSSMRSGAARSGDSWEETSYSTLRTTVRGPGTITFKWASSTEFDEYDPSQKFDVGTFYVDGDVQAEIWGTNDWKEVSFTITEDGAEASDHELCWEYAKDWMDDEYIFDTYEIKDCIWVDEFVWKPVPDMKQCDVSVSPLTYSQGPQVPTIAVTNRETKVGLTRGVDYEYTVSGQQDAGTYTLTVFGLGTTYTGSNEVQWTIAPLSISNAAVTLSGDQVYTRDVHGPVVQRATVENIYVDTPNVGRIDVVFDKSWSLTSGSTNATEAGTYEITLTGSGNLSGSVSTNWVIAPRPITADMITVPTDIVYFGGETNVTTSADFKVVYEGETIVWANAVGNLGTNAATYTVTVSAVTNDTLKDYTGSASKDWTIAPFDFDQYGSVLALTNETFVYTGYEQTNEVDYVRGMHPAFGPIVFSNDTWWVSNNVATTVGEYWAYLYPEGDANFCGGPISNRWQIVPYTGDVDVEFGPWPVYEGGGTALSPTITSVTTVPGGFPLVADRDYTVAYTLNTKYAQHGTLTIVGQGNFAGLCKAGVAFEILPEQIENTTITLTDASYVYDGTEKVPGITMTLPNGKEVKMDQSPKKGDKKIGGWMIQAGSVTNATKASTNQIYIAGYYDDMATAGSTYTGNIQGTTNVTWEILCCDMSNDVNVVQSADSFVYNREEQKPTVTVTSKLSGVPFVEGEDYEIVWPTDCVNASNLTYYVKGIGSVTNTYEMHYSITPAQISDLQFQAQKGKPWVCTYDGTKHSPKVAYVKATSETANDLTLDESEYTLTNVGKTDVGEYTSEVKSASRNFSDPTTAISANWKITPKDISTAEVVVTLKHPIVYNAAAQKLDASVVQKITVNAGSLEVKGVSYTCPTHTDAGDYNDAVVTATDKNFTGSHTVQWTIEQRDISTATAFAWNDNARLLWTGGELTPTVKEISLPAIDGYEAMTLPGNLATLTADDIKVEAGRYESSVTGSVNFKGTTPMKMTWEIAPRAPAITPNDGTGKYTKLTDYVTVEINNDRDDQLWKICYTTNDWAETMVYPNKGWKFDIDRHTVVQAYSVSCDGLVTGETSRCEYFFGKQNVTPTIALTAKAGAEEGRPASWMQDGLETVVTGEAQIITFKNVGGVVTNFFHKETRVALTRFGGMTQAEIDKIVERETVGGLCPYTDGEIWYTVAENGAPVADPTNATGFTSRKFDKDDVTTWPLISTNAVIVAKVFGDQLESSATVTNAFFRQWTAMPKPTITADTETFHTNVTVSITTNTLDACADWTYTNANQKIWITVGDKTPFLYTNAFELTWADCAGDPEQVTVQAVSKYGEDYIDSEADTKTFTHEKKAFPMPTLTESSEFRHSSPAFAVLLTNNAPLGVGGVLTYSINGSDPIPCGEDDVSTYLVNITTTTVVRVWVEANGDAHDYYNSETNEAIYTYSPYKMVRPVIGPKDIPTFDCEDFQISVSRPVSSTPVEDEEHIYHGTVWYSLDGGANWKAVPDGSPAATMTISETTTVMAKHTREDHLDSDVVTKTFTRFVNAPTITLVKEDDTAAYVETPAGATNYFHKAFVKMDCTGGDTHVEYTLVEEGQSERKGTYTDKIPVANTFTVTAVAKSKGGSASAPVTMTITRQWETLAQPAITLIDPNGDSQTGFKNTGDRIAITNDMTALVQHAAVLWPTNFTVKYAVYTNSEDVTTVPTSWAAFVQGVTTNFFKADTNAVWAIVEADDYLPSTNAVSFTRQLGEVSEPTIFLDNSTSRTNVTVSILQPVGAGAVRVYYTFAVTNKTAEVAEPVGNEYDVTKTSARYEGPFDVAIGPDQTLIVKARAYVEDGSSELVGVAETNFTARGSVVTNALALAWTIGDALDAPDQTFVTYDTVAKTINNVCLEDTHVFTTGGSSMVYTNLVDGETVTISTTVTGPGTVVFDWKTSCEKGQHGYNRDHFAFSVDGVEITCLDGNSGWQTVTNYVSGLADQAHTLAWSYKKDATEKQRDDSAWLDHVRWVASDKGIVISAELDGWARDVFGDDYVDTVLSPGGVVNAEEWTAALALTGANGRSYYDCYVLGLDVDDFDSEFDASDLQLVYIDDLEGKQVLKSVTINWTPCTKAGRTYTLVGKRELIETDWMILAEQNATADDPEGGSITASMLNETFKDCKFFQLRVRMTE